MRWRMIGYMGALFVAGAITGAAVMSRTAAGSQTLKIGRTEEMAQLIEQKMQPLHLTSEQREKIRPLIKQASVDLESSHLTCLQKCAAIVDEMHTLMAPILTPEQRDQLQTLEAERRERLQKKYNFTLSQAPSAHH
jgi:Spy/CpxP family protein refolding chaperone